MRAEQLEAASPPRRETETLRKAAECTSHVSGETGSRRVTWHASTLGKCLRSVSSLFAFEQQKQEEDCN